MRRLLLTTASCLVPALASAAESGDYMVQARAAIWYATPQAGDVLTASGDTEDLDSVGLDEGNVGFYVEAGVSPPLPFIPNVVVGYTSFDTESDDDDDDAELGLTDAYLELNYGVDALGYAGVNVGIALHNLGAEIDTEGTTTVDDDAWLAALALRAFIFPTDSLDVQARLHWGAIGDDTILDAEALVSWYVTDYVGLQAGFRVMQAELDDGDDLDVTLTGPVLGAVIQY